MCMIVSGFLTPNWTGTYDVAGVYNGYSYYKLYGVNQYISWGGAGVGWVISDTLGTQNPPWWGPGTGGLGNPTGTYPPGTGATGTATVTSC